TPFVDEASLARGCLKALRSLDPGLSKYFERMYDLGLLDLTSRKGKAPGGYQDVLAEHRLPFIFMNAAGRDQDMRTLLHESGHSAHTFLMNEAGLPNYNSNGNLPLEFAEVASTSMELLGGYHIEGAFYSRDDARRSNREALADIAKLFTWVATIDSFQHWVYTHPAHSREERAKAWAETFRRFSGLEDYGDHEDALRFRWQRQQHLFGAPFYYIEYGIALVGALGVWLRYKEDRGSALNGYKQALSLGATKPLPELFAAAGLEWDFGPRSLGRLARELRSAVKEYSE
ncbi:MAG TPA: M3 family metallopeptidase, partial [Nitrososphaerales archaeon]|nr:M3 family metallopeptidase [Nitrososphaerales archaeon]